MDKDLYDYLDCAEFSFIYKCGAEEKKTIVSFKHINSSVFAYVVDGTVGDTLDVTDYAACFDWDDVASVLAKKFITNSDSSIRVIINVDSSCFFSSLTLKQDGSQIQEECEYELTISPNIDQRIIEVVEVEKNMVDDIVEWIESDDEDGDLYDYCYNNVEDMVSFLPLYGDEESETLDYEIEDENHNVIKEGTIQLSEGNAFNYIGGGPINPNYNPKYVLVHFDITHHPIYIYDIPKNFKVEEIRFLKNKMLSSKSYPTYELEEFGDTNISLYGIRYHGMELECDENDRGSYGDNTYYLFELNEETNKYKLKAKTER